MSRLPPFDPLGPGGNPPAIPAIPATPGEQNSKNSDNSKGTPQEYAGPPNAQEARLKYPSHDKATNAELADLEAQVNTKGYVLLWSNVLDDSIAFYRTEEDRKMIPPGFVPYSKEELGVLFAEGDKAPSLNGLRLIHEAKRLGGRVIGSEPEHEGEAP